MIQSRRLLFALVLGLVVAACGGSQGGPATTTAGPGTTQLPSGNTTTQPTQPGPASTQPPPQGDLGWFSIDGERIDANQVVRCEEVGGLDTPSIYAWGPFGDGRIQLVLSLQESRVDHHVELYGQGYESFGSLWDENGDENWRDRFTGDPASLTYDGGRARGGPALVGDQDGDQALIEWDLVMPANEDPNC